METTCDQPINDRICQRNESIQYNAARTKNGAIKGAFQTKPHQEFGLESLKFRAWFRTLCTLYKIKPPLYHQKKKQSHYAHSTTIIPIAELIFFFFFQKTFFLL